MERYNKLSDSPSTPEKGFIGKAYDIFSRDKLGISIVAGLAFLGPWTLMPGFERTSLSKGLKASCEYSIPNLKSENNYRLLEFLDLDSDGDLDARRTLEYGDLGKISCIYMRDGDNLVYDERRSENASGMDEISLFTSRKKRL